MVDIQVYVYIFAEYMRAHVEVAGGYILFDALVFARAPQYMYMIRLYARGYFWKKKCKKYSFRSTSLNFTHHCENRSVGDKKNH